MESCRSLPSTCCFPSCHRGSAAESVTENGTRPSVWTSLVKPVRCHSADGGDDEEDTTTMGRRLRAKWTERTRGSERANRVGPENPYVASTPTYSGANNGAFALKGRVVMLHSAAAPIPDSIYNHQSKSPIFIRTANTLFFCHYLSRYYL